MGWLEMAHYLVNISDIDVNLERWDGLLAFHQAKDIETCKFLVEDAGSNIYACNSVR